MKDFENLTTSLFLLIIATAIFGYALSAAGRRWRRGFAEKSLGWLSSLSRRAITGRWILLGIVFCFIPLAFKIHPDPRLLIAIFGGTGGIANMLWELSSYADLEIEVRKRLSTR